MREEDSCMADVFLEDCKYDVLRKNVWKSRNLYVRLKITTKNIPAAPNRFLPEGGY